MRRNKALKFDESSDVAKKIEASPSKLYNYENTKHFASNNIYDFLTLDSYFENIELSLYLKSENLKLYDSLDLEERVLNFNEVKTFLFKGCSINLNDLVPKFFVSNYLFKELDISATNLSIYDIDRLCSKLKNPKYLQRLNVSLNRIKAPLLIESLRQNLKHLDVSGNYLSETSIMEILSYYESMNSISIAKNTLSDQSSSLLCKHIKNNPFKYIDISRTQISSKSLLRFIEVISSCELKVIHLAELNFDSMSIDKISNSNFENLSYLNMSYNGLEQDDINRVVSNDSFIKLDTLDLSKNDMVSLELNQRIDNIKNLNLSHNPLKSSEIEKMSKYKLKNLDWSINDICFLSLNRYINSEYFNELESLNLDSCKSLSKECNVDFRSLQKSNLKFLYMNYIGLSEKIVENIIFHIPASLRWIELSLNRINYGTLRRFISSYSGNSLYIDLTLSHSMNRDQEEEIYDLAKQKNITIKL